MLVILAHSASGANWVLSTVMMQRWVEDEVRGRVFSVDMLILSIAFSTSTSVAGYVMENTGLGIQNGILVFASVMVLSGLVFAAWKPGEWASIGLTPSKHRSWVHVGGVKYVLVHPVQRCPTAGLLMPLPRRTRPMTCARRQVIFARRPKREPEDVAGLNLRIHRKEFHFGVDGLDHGRPRLDFIPASVVAQIHDGVPQVNAVALIVAVLEQGVD